MSATATTARSTGTSAGSSRLVRLLAVLVMAGGVVLTLDGPVQDFPPVGAPFLVAHPGAADELFQVWTAAVTGGGSAS